MNPENKNKPNLLARTIILILILMIIMYLAMTLINELILNNKYFSP